MIKLKAKAVKFLKNQSQVLPFDQVTTPKQIKKKEANSKISRIKECVKEATLSSTIHGIPNALRAEKTFIKFLWIIGFLTTVSTSIYLISKNINDYLEYETVTKISVINEQPTIFPTLSFQFNYSNFQGNYSLENNVIKLFYENIGLNISESFQIVQYKTNKIYKFNSGINNTGQKIDIKKQKIAGDRGGFYSEVFIGLPKQFNSSLNFGIPSRNSFFSLYIHNKSMNPAEMNEQPIKLPPGFSTEISVSKIFTDRLPYPYNDCFDDLKELKSHDSLLVQYILTKTNSIYRQKDCLNLCQTEYLIKHCNLSSQLGFIWEIDRNENDDCQENETKSFFSKDINEYCTPFCPMECDSIDYKIDLMSSVFPNQAYASELALHRKIKPKYPNGTNITLEDLRASVVAFSVYYSDFKYTYIQQLPKMQIVDAVSNFGGLLGLFVGVSFLSFIELIECLIQIVLISLEKK